jgi:hypothetical protein
MKLEGWARSAAVQAKLASAAVEGRGGETVVMEYPLMRQR